MSEQPLVKELQWRFFDVTHEYGKGVWDANGPWTTYTIQVCDEARAAPAERYYVPALSDVFSDLDAAKAAAQADYERRILSALTPALPASAGGGEAILHAALDCPHEIDGEKVVLKASLSKPGNALAQLSTRLSAALKAETTPAALRGYCTDCESETEIQNGRCGCGSGRVIVGGLKAETSQ